MPSIAAGRGEGFSAFEQSAFLKQLFLDPERHRHPERLEPAWRVGEIGLHQPLEFDQRLLEEDDMVDAVEIDVSALSRQ